MTGKNHDHDKPDDNHETMPTANVETGHVFTDHRRADYDPQNPDHDPQGHHRKTQEEKQRDQRNQALVKAIAPFGPSPDLLHLIDTLGDDVPAWLTIANEQVGPISLGDLRAWKDQADQPPPEEPPPETQDHAPEPESKRKHA